MKKYTTLFRSLGLVCYSAIADITAPFTLATHTMNAIYTNGPIKVTKIIIIAPTATNVLVSGIDSMIGNLSWTNAQYTNTISYATNLVVMWTNVYGVVTYTTNLSLIDVTNNTITATTNLWPTRFTSAVAASGSSTINGVSYLFYNGLWVTNQGAGDAQVVFEYQRLY